MDRKELTQINNVIIYRNFVENLPYNPNLKERARKLRKIGNFAEVVFWKEVHRKKFHSLDFDRQRVIGNYIVDFYVKTLGLVIEIDGSSHNSKDEYDDSREAFLKSCNLKVFRATDFRVLHDLENVLINLEDFIIREYS